MHTLRLSNPTMSETLWYDLGPEDEFLSPVKVDYGWKCSECDASKSDSAVRDLSSLSTHSPLIKSLTLAKFLNYSGIDRPIPLIEDLELRYDYNSLDYIGLANSLNEADSCSSVKRKPKMELPMIVNGFSC